MSVTQSVKPTFSNKNKKNAQQNLDAFQDSKKTSNNTANKNSQNKDGDRRELQKTDWVKSSNIEGTNIDTSLNDLDNQGARYD